VATAGSLITDARLRPGSPSRSGPTGGHALGRQRHERGRSERGAAAVDQLLEAAGMRLELAPRHRPRRGRRFGARLLDVLGLADALPQRHAPKLAYPPLAERAR
jgi:hypothetical protein